MRDPKNGSNSDGEIWLWPFVLTEKIGQGGMGEVYRGHFIEEKDKEVKREVAVKLMPADVTDKTILARFERELEVLRKLRHPNIVHCFGGECKNHRRFYAMELVQGGTLDQVLDRRGALPWELAVEYGRQICEGLAYAHQHGVIHRDIKPDNFLITPEGKLKLSDFGLASVMAGRRITAAGKTMGTIRYMAPEQIAGQPVGPQTDLYSFGCVMFEMLVGHPPFTGNTQAETLQMHLKAPVPRITAEALDIPPGLEQLVQDLLEKKAVDRPPDAREVGRRLRTISPVIAIRSGKPTSGVSSRPTEVTRAALSSSAETADALPARSVPSTIPVRLERGLQAAVVVAAVLLLAVMFLMAGRSNRQAARQHWIDAFTQPGPTPVRVHAARVLGQIGQGEKEVVELLTGGIDDPDPEVRAAAIKALGDLEGDARSAIGRLIKTQKTDDDTAVRVAAGFALETIRDGGGAKGHWKSYLLVTLVCASAGAIVWQIGRWCAAARRPDPAD